MALLEVNDLRKSFATGEKALNGTQLPFIINVFFLVRRHFDSGL